MGPGRSYSGDRFVQHERRSRGHRPFFRPQPLGRDATGMNSPLVPLAPGAQGALFTAGVALTLLGIYLRWRWPDYRMITEERRKDGRLTEAQARRRMSMMRFGGPVAVLLAIALFAIVFWH